MNFSQLIKKTGFNLNPAGLEDFSVRGISCNSAKVRDGFVFVAIQGNNVDGHDFIDEAIKKGVRGIVHSSRCKVRGKTGVACVPVDDPRMALAVLAAEFYGHPSSKLKVIGVTGTNGKTTVTYLLESMLKEAGFSVGVIGTVNYRFKDKALPSLNTTPCAVEIQSMLAEMAQEKVKFAVMEVSSHALDQRRVEGVRFAAAIFTNLTQDHLDYHRGMEGYFLAKARLFQGLDKEAFCILNYDDDYAGGIEKITPAKIVTYGINRPAQVMADKMQYSPESSRFTLKGLKGGEAVIESSFIGKHNIYNILAACACCQALGIDFDKAGSTLSRRLIVPGRLQRVEHKGGFSVFIDYAHTEDALENVLSSLRQIAKSKIILVFGCGGCRDKTKRPKMGRVATELADYAVITSDNPRDEDPLSIIEEITRGIRGENFCVEPDRRQAIKKALSMAGKTDIVLIAGKGHENYQVFKNRKEHFDDIEVAGECLKQLNY